MLEILNLASDFKVGCRLRVLKKLVASEGLEQENGAVWGVA